MMRIQHIIERFKPPILLRNRHIQTVLGPILRRNSPVRPNSTPWTATCSDITLHGKWWKKPGSKQAIALFHGLGGSMDSSYLIGMANALQEHFSVLRVALRGGNDDSAHTYHAGLTQDIDCVVQKLRDEGYRVSLVGFSLSASMILKWLEKKQPIESAFLISPPIHLEECVGNIDDPKNRIYQNYFMKKLGSFLKEKSKRHPNIFTPYLRPETFSSLKNFDSLFTAKRYGYASVNEYYSTSSPKNISRIENDVCIVHSLDDPFVGNEELISLKNLHKPNLQVCLTKFGGHVGFYGGPGKGFMIDPWAVEYFRETLLCNGNESDN